MIIEISKVIVCLLFDLLDVLINDQSIVKPLLFIFIHLKDFRAQRVGLQLIDLHVKDVLFFLAVESHKVIGQEWY